MKYTYYGHACFEFDFMGGSMGSVVGEKLTRLIEYATQEGLTLIVVCTSGGARMQVCVCAHVCMYPSQP